MQSIKFIKKLINTSTFINLIDLLMSFKQKIYPTKNSQNKTRKQSIDQQQIGADPPVMLFFIFLHAPSTCGTTNPHI